MGTIEIIEPGFLFVYLSYENESDNWVYFDDLKITHTPTNIVQYNDYYPYGLQTNASWTREDSHNNHLYNQGNELNPSTGWYETFFRNYDPALGRFTAIDPLATKFASLSGYHYAYNNPVMFNDPLGAQGEPGNPWFSGGYRWMENMSPPPAAYNFMGASTFGSTMDNYWYQAMNGNNYAQKQMLAAQARGGDTQARGQLMGMVGGTLTRVSSSDMEIWHSTSQAGGDTYYHYEIVVGEGNGQNEGGVFQSSLDGLGIYGLMLGVFENAVHNDHWWIGQNGKVYINHGNNYVLNRSKDLAAKVAKPFKIVGQAAFWAGAAISVGGAGYYYYNGGTDPTVGVKAGADVLFGAVGTWGGPIGLGIGIIYFGVDQTIGWDNASNSLDIVIRKNQVIHGTNWGPFRHGGIK